MTDAQAWPSGGAPAAMVVEAVRPTVDPASSLPSTDSTPGSVRVRSAFEAARRDGRIGLIPYVVAGYPDLATSERIALAAIDAGADLLEIGLPYSDPLADGATLQRASSAALRAGQTLGRSLELVERLHAARPATPLVPMAYVNQVVGRGDPGVPMRRLAAAGASACILADLTPDEGAPVERAAVDAGLGVVYLVTPTTAAERRTWIASRTGGFLYVVSLVGVTGARAALPREVAAFVREVRSLSPVPVAVGFGVSRPAHVRRLARVADGVIVASALVDALGPDGRDVTALAGLVRSLRAATAIAPAIRAR